MRNKDKINVKWRKSREQKLQSKFLLVIFSEETEFRARKMSRKSRENSFEAICACEFFCALKGALKYHLQEFSKRKKRIVIHYSWIQGYCIHLYIYLLSHFFYFIQRRWHIWEYMKIKGSSIKICNRFRVPPRSRAFNIKNYMPFTCAYI